MTRARNEGIDIDFQDFAERSMDLLSVARTDGYFYWLNGAWEKQLGWTLDELRSVPFVEFIHPDDVPATRSEVERLARGSETIRFTNRYRDKRGAWHWMEWNARPIANGLLYANCRDISGYREQLAITERQVALLRLAEDIGGVGHWRVETDKEEAYWSPQVYRIFGYAPGAIIPTRALGRGAFHPDDRVQLDARVEAAIATKGAFEFTLRLLRTDGSERLVRSLGRCELDPQNLDVVALNGVFQDVTERDQEWRRSNEELRQFAYAASHDLQAPLRTLMGFGELLREEISNLTPKATEYVARMVKSADRLQKLIAELYKYAGATRTDDALQPVDLDALMEEVRDTLAPALAEGDLHLTVDPLPKVIGRRAQLVSVFLNVLGNAIKFRSAEKPTIRVRTERLGSLFAISVEDNGIGFSDNDNRRVFGLFQTAHSGSSYEGMGVGLALVKRIVENHGGHVHAMSTPGRGTTIRFTLPAVTEASG